MPAKGMRKGFVVCKACGIVFRLKDGGICKNVSMCADCCNAVGICEMCSGEMPKYSRKDASERKTCSILCHNRRITSNPEWRAGQSERAKRTYEKMSQNPEYMKWLREVGSKLHTFHGDDFPSSTSERVLKMYEDEEFKATWRTAYDTSRPRAKRNAAKTNRDNWNDPEYRERHTAILDRARAMPGVNEKISAGLKRAHAAGKFLDVNNSHIRLRRTNLERAVELPLFLSGIPYIRNLRVWRYYIDFAIPDVMIGIEADGYHWHCNRVEQDAKRDAYLAGRGWTIIRLTEAEIKEDVIQALSIKVLPLIESALKLMD